MKYILIILTSIFFVFNQTSNALAIEGTCSWHSGINCKAGPDWDGSAICYDGWLDSSERYYSQKMCTENLHHCSTEVAQQLNSKYLLDELSNTVKNTCKVSVSDYSLNNLSSSELRQKAIDALYLAAECKNAVLDYDVAETKYYKECYALGEKHYYEQQAEFLKSLQQSYSQPQSVPTYSCPANSTLNANNQCSCNYGYANYKNQCTTADDYCKLTLGVNSIARIVDGVYRCACDTGYVWNSTQTTCNKIETQSIQSSITQTPPQQVIQPKSTNPIIQSQPSQPKIKPSSVSTEKNFYNNNHN